METKLQVRDLRISFRTANGKVQAVRGISFDLAKGETLAIVGESGSGKSVTSKAILGIQAGNSITESGEIIYDGQDLLKISEEDFHKIRGDKIAMIFQDPMSSLNPIVRIGRQLTEAMILKGKIRQRESRRNFDSRLKALSQAMKSSSGWPEREVDEACAKFRKFEYKHIELQKAYNTARDSAAYCLSGIRLIAFEMEKRAVGGDGGARMADIVDLARKTSNPFVVPEGEARRMAALADSAASLWKTARKRKEYGGLLPVLREMEGILEKAVARKKPNFFRMGYYLTFVAPELPDLPVDELDARMREAMWDGFMRRFNEGVEKALRHTAGICYANIEKASALLKARKGVFAGEALDRKACKAALSELQAAVEATVDPLALSKDSLIWTFLPALRTQTRTWSAAISGNRRALRAHEREVRKHDRLARRMARRRRTLDWTVAEASVVDLDLVRSNIAGLIDRLVAHYGALLEARAGRDYAAETTRTVDYLMESASGIIDKVTLRGAKEKAIRLMDEVGIDEPHKRFRQYPFEFSGGMRQRIVIAIALAANPDILICDEPTTALDVTIQSQILELINQLKRERQLSVIFITHDLGVVANMADRVAVMYAGKIVELGTAEDVFYDARHPYTWALLSSMPDLDTNEKLEAIPGTPPNMIYPPKGDAFAPRNKYAMRIDFERQPPMFKISDTHYAATWLLHPDAPAVAPPRIVTDRIARMKAKREGGNEQ